MIKKLLHNSALFSLLLCGQIAFNTHAERVEFVESAYSAQAPQEILDVVEKITDNLDFKEKYEVIIPKKPILELNPWTHFVVSDINPNTKNFVVIINPTWFGELTQDEQDYIITYNFLNQQLGKTSRALTMLDYSTIALTFLLMVLIIVGLGYFYINLKLYQRIFIAFAIIVCLELIVFDRIHAKIKESIAWKHDVSLQERAIKKAGSREAALTFFEKLNTSIADHIGKGEKHFIPLAGHLLNIEKELKKNQ